MSFIPEVELQASNTTNDGMQIIRNYLKIINIQTEYILKMKMYAKSAIKYGKTKKYSSLVGSSQGYCSFKSTVRMHKTSKSSITNGRDTCIFLSILKYKVCNNILFIILSPR